MIDLVIKGGTVLTMNGEVIENGVVAVENNVIIYVGKDTKIRAEKIIDAKGCAVMPGLINAHTHLPMTLFRGYAADLPYGEWIKKIQKAEMKLTSKDVRAGASLGVLEMIRSGTTSFADMYIYMDDVAEVIERTGIRAALGYGMIESLNEDPGTKLKNREIFTRRWNGASNGRISTMYAPHSALSCSEEFLIKVRELCEKEASRLHIHVLETEDELNCMKKRYGMCSINFLNNIKMLGPHVIAVHCIWLSDDDIEILKTHHVSVVHCPSSNMALGVGIAPVPRMLEKDINVALGTDGAASSCSLDMWKEMRIASLLHKLKDPKALPASRVLEMATVNGAKALGIKAGMLKEGCLADIIIVDMKGAQFISSNLVASLVNGASGCDVKTTIVDGKVLMEDRNIMGLDEDKIIEDAIKAMAILDD